MKLQHDPVISLADLSGDLGRRYKTTPTGGASFDPGLVDSDLAAVQRDGYVIWENLLSEEECERIRDAVTPLLDHNGRNTFEGRRTQRLQRPEQDPSLRSARRPSPGVGPA